MTTTKRLPYEKTVVTEVKIQLADLLSRTVMLKNSVAAPIPTSDSFNQGDTTVSLDSPLDIEQVKSCLIISSLEDFDVIFPGADDVTLHCKGLFIHNGSAPRVVVKPTSPATQARVQYIWS